MRTKTKHPTLKTEEIWEEDFFNSYLKEMDELISRYPEDPNAVDLNEQKLHALINELDQSWQEFQQKWQKKLSRSEKIFARAAVEKKDGMRHLIIRSEFNDRELLDLQLPDDETVLSE